VIFAQSFPLPFEIVVFIRENKVGNAYEDMDKIACPTKKI